MRANAQAAEKHTRAGGGIYLSHNTPDGEGAGLCCSVTET